MGTTAGVGMSHHRNPREAGREAAQAAMVHSGLAQAGVERPDFVFLFSSVGYPQEALLASVRQATGRAPLCGCSGEGIIAGFEADESNFSAAVLVVASDELTFTNGVVPGLRADSHAVGRKVGERVGEAIRPDSNALFVLADGLSFNFDRFSQGFQEGSALDRPLPFFGGTSADNWELKRTYQYADDTITDDGVAWALLSGARQVVWGVNHGCVPIGVERKVTKCQGNVLFEIDGLPVLDVLKEYLVGEEVENWQKAIVNLCLGFKAPESMTSYDEYLIRFMPAKDDAKGSVTIPTEVTEGTSVWMTRRDHEKIAAGVERMGDEIRGQLPAGRAPKLVFQFDCAGRGKVVFRDQQKTDLLRRLREKVGAEVPWLGFYTYGEIGPVGATNCFHNYTAVVMAIA